MQTRKILIIVLLAGAAVALPFISRGLLDSDAKEVTVAPIAQRRHGCR